MSIDVVFHGVSDSVRRLAHADASSIGNTLSKGRWGTKYGPSVQDNRLVCLVG